MKVLVSSISQYTKCFLKKKEKKTVSNTLSNVWLACMECKPQLDWLPTDLKVWLACTPVMQPATWLAPSPHGKALTACLAIRKLDLILSQWSLGSTTIQSCQHMQVNRKTTWRASDMSAPHTHSVWNKVSTPQHASCTEQSIPGSSKVMPCCPTKVQATWTPSKVKVMSFMEVKLMSSHPHHLQWQAPFFASQSQEGQLPEGMVIFQCEDTMATVSLEPCSKWVKITKRPHRVSPVRP